jgi:hypothetical protein
MPIWIADEQEELWNHFEDMVFGEQRSKDRVSRFHRLGGGEYVDNMKDIMRTR